MWRFFSRTYRKPGTGAPIYFTNTLTGKKELFVPRRAGMATLYSCGPTVYGPQHIGNLRAAVFADTIARVLIEAGYRLRRVINITDVGHLVGDGDEGEDKMAVGARREQATPEEIAKRYTDRYLRDIQALNLDTHTILFPRATEYIDKQIEFVAALMKKKYAYEAENDVYFDTNAFPAYGKLGGIRDVAQKEGARVARVVGKRNPHDFVLWRHAKEHDLQQWDSPWGAGNPGWHIECSTMIRALLGDEIDIHSGGMDHIAVHHNNEIAQSEALTGRPLARYWLHNAFLTIEGAKISKSVGNVHTLSDILERGLHPLALRYFFLQAHFRSPLSFSFEALHASAEGLLGLWNAATLIREKSGGRGISSEASERLVAIVRDDLKTPQGLALLQEAVRNDELSPAEHWGLLAAAETLFGLSLTNPPELPEAVSAEELPDEVRLLATEREEAREKRDFPAADALRVHIEERGYRVDDGPSGTTYIKKG